MNAIFQQALSPFITAITAYKAVPVQKRADFFLLVVKFAFFASWLLFPFGKAFRVAGGILCLAGLIGYYANGYRNSVLASYRGRWLIGIFLLFVISNTVFSKWFIHSFEYVKPTLNESWPFLFAGLESIRSSKDIKLLGGMFFLALFGEGIVGTWQYITGFDPINGDPWMAGRLTGSMGSYRVGNYIGIGLLPACIAYFLFPEAWNPRIKAAILGLLFIPALVLLIGSQTRSGMLGVVAGAYLLCVFRFRTHKKVIFGIPLAFLLLTLIGPDRISLARALNDARGEIWSFAWQIFKEYPLFGAGASTFKPAFMDLGLVLVRNTDIPHPHCIYLQFLSDGGITGFLIGMTFLAAPWGWCGWNIFNGTAAVSERVRRFWWSAAYIWAGYSCYLATGLFGHNFYRTWWLAMGMALMGASIAACLAAKRFEQHAEVAK